VILDVFSRYAVGWMIAQRELAMLAHKLIKETIVKQTVEPNKLTIHADRGSSMTSKPVALLLADLGVTKSHSRPHVSNDNCYSESQFKTLKYRRGFPDRFGSIQDARVFSVSFFDWYNRAHRHSGIGMMTPQAMHYGCAKELQLRRAACSAGAYERHPERFPRGLPQPGSYRPQRGSTHLRSARRQRR
ncbi:MAG: transposase family protein, partial [Actinobacteria bacterium]|nr:transposase family protein [Actinomycetota bacterium]